MGFSKIKVKIDSELPIIPKKNFTNSRQDQGLHIKTTEDNWS